MPSAPTIHAAIVRFAADRVGGETAFGREGNGRIPLGSFVAFLESAAEKAGDLALGARIGADFSPMDLGPLGLIFLSSPTLGDVFADYQRYSKLTQGETLFFVERQEDLAFCHYRVMDSSVGTRRQDSEFSLSSLCALIRSVLGRRWAPVEVHFEHGGPADGKILSRIFGAPVRFGENANRLVIEAADLKRGNGQFNPAVRPLVQDYLLDLLRRDEDRESFAALVAAAVARGMGEHPMTVPAIAEKLAVSPRTLQRRLAAEKTSLRQILADYRKEVATRLLRRGGMRVTTVAHNLGYADGTVLARSFKAWTGSTPRRFAQED